MTKITHLFAASLLLMTVLSFDNSAQAQSKDLEARVAGLEAQNAEQQEQIAVLLDLTRSMYADEENVYFEGVNVHVRDGSEQTHCVGGCNGLGNLIVGYDEFGSQGNDKSGSHNIVVGVSHTYSSYGGLVAGRENQIAGPYSTVTGGRNNLAKGSYSSVSGGYTNRAEQYYSSVLGGRDNIASGSHRSVSGGTQCQASARSGSRGGGRVW
jgi:hypothetical protein